MESGYLNSKVCGAGDRAETDTPPTVLNFTPLALIHIKVISHPCTSTKKADFPLYISKYNSYKLCCVTFIYREFVIVAIYLKYLLKVVSEGTRRG